MPIDYYLVAGPSFKTIVDRYKQVTSRPSMLPLWAFGFWQSRCFYSSFADIDVAASRLQKDGVPLDVMVVDSDWSHFEMNFKWKPKFLGGRYLYTLARAANATGLPIARPLVLEYQDDAGSATAMTEFLFGPDIRVAPVLYGGAVARDVYFPPGRWISYDDGFEVAGGRSIGVSAPRDRLPLFVRAGAILPCAPEMTSTGQRPWDPITPDVWPAGESTATLYDDDHETLAFTRGKSTTTTFRCAETPGESVALDIAPSND